jgi:hypothetical protein
MVTEEVFEAHTNEDRRMKEELGREISELKDSVDEFKGQFMTYLREQARG